MAKIITEAAQEFLEKFFKEAVEQGTKQTAEELAEAAARKLAKEGLENLTKEAVQEFMQNGLKQSTREALEGAGVRLANTQSGVAEIITTGKPVSGFSRQAPEIGGSFEGVVPSRVTGDATKKVWKQPEPKIIGVGEVPVDAATPPPFPKQAAQTPPPLPQQVPPASGAVSGSGEIGDVLIKDKPVLIELSKVADANLEGAISTAKSNFKQIKDGYELRQPQKIEVTATPKEQFNYHRTLKSKSSDASEKATAIVKEKGIKAEEAHEAQMAFSKDLDKTYRARREDAAVEVIYLSARKYNRDIGSGVLKGSKSIDMDSPNDIFSKLLVHAKNNNDDVLFQSLDRANKDMDFHRYNEEGMVTSHPKWDVKKWESDRISSKSGAERQEYARGNFESDAQVALAGPTGLLEPNYPKMLANITPDLTPTGFAKAGVKGAIYAANPPIGFTASAINPFNGKGFLSRGVHLAAAAVVWAGAAVVKEGADTFDAKGDVVVDREDRFSIIDAGDNYFPFVGESKLQPYWNSSAGPILFNTGKTVALVATGVYEEKTETDSPEALSDQNKTDWSSLLKANRSQNEQADRVQPKGTNWQELIGEQRAGSSPEASVDPSALPKAPQERPR